MILPFSLPVFVTGVICAAAMSCHNSELINEQQERQSSAVGDKRRVLSCGKKVFLNVKVVEEVLVGQR